MSLERDIDRALSSTTGPRVVVRLSTAKQQIAFARAWGKYFAGLTGGRMSLMSMVEDGDCMRVNRSDFAFHGDDHVSAAVDIADSVPGAKVLP